MSDLLSLLSLGSAGIQAQNTGISIATNNAANVNTAGYSRQRTDLQALLGAPLVGGVRAGSPDRLQDYLLSGRIRTAGGALSMSTAFYEAVTDIEARLASSGEMMHEQLGTLSSKFAALSADPIDGASRDAVVTAARDLIAGIRRRSAELDRALSESTERIRQRAEEASLVAARLAESNLEVARTGDPTMKDERDRLANQLADLVGGSTRIDPDGNMRFILDGGAVLVDGKQAAKLEASPDPATGDTKVAVVAGTIRRDVTDSIRGGSIGADLAVNRGPIADARKDLDQLAFDIGSAYNAVHTANAGLDGVSGRPMFTPLAQVTGAAQTLDLDPALVADPSLLAAGAPGGRPGDNTGALALQGVATSPVAANGKSLINSALDLVSKVVVRASEAKAEVGRDQIVSDHLASLRDSLAGVDLQEELTNLARFEHASSAMTRFVSTVDGLLGDLIDRL